MLFAAIVLRSQRRDQFNLQGFKLMRLPDGSERHVFEARLYDLATEPQKFVTDFERAASNPHWDILEPPRVLLFPLPDPAPAFERPADYAASLALLPRLQDATEQAALTAFAQARFDAIEEAKAGQEVQPPVPPVQPPTPTAADLMQDTGAIPDDGDDGSDKEPGDADPSPNSEIPSSAATPPTIPTSGKLVIGSPPAAPPAAKKAAAKKAAAK